jgi:hypothetical protein
MDFPVLSLLYNEEEFAKTPKNQKEIFIYEWLRNLENDLSNVSRVRTLSAYFKPFFSALILI